MKVKCTATWSKRKSLFNSDRIDLMVKDKIYDIEFWGFGEFAINYTQCVFYGEDKEWHSKDFDDVKEFIVPVED